MRRHVEEPRHLCTMKQFQTREASIIVEVTVRSRLKFKQLLSTKRPVIKR